MEDFAAELRALPFETLVRTVNSYPWFGAAQKALCERMTRLGGKDLSRRQFADATLHVASQGRLASLLREEVSCADADIADLLRKYMAAAEEAKVAAEKEAGENTESEGNKNEGESVGMNAAENAGQNAKGDGGSARKGVNQNFRGVGDYFSREQYDEVRGSGAGLSLGRAGSASVGNTGGDMDGGHSRGGANLTKRGAEKFGGVTSGTAREGQWNSSDISVDDFCTETLAKIYEDQGYFDKAKEIYAKLILAYPEKSAYFASLIEKMN